MSETKTTTPRFKRDGRHVYDTETGQRIEAGFNHKLQASDCCALLNDNPKLADDYRWEDAK